MSLTPSTMLALGTRAPPFKLADTQGGTISIHDYDDQPALLVMFICNHCPYVRHIRAKLAQVARVYEERGVGVVAINSNDLDEYPEDGPDNMAEEKQRHGYVFPYLFDERQEVAKAYHAACTPDFFLFDRDRKLVYRGQFDDARPGNKNPVTGKDLTAAVDAVLAGTPVPKEQTPSMGCNIKWKAGNAPPYYG